MSKLVKVNEIESGKYLFLKVKNINGFPRLNIGVL